MENYRWASDGTPPPPELTRRFRLSDEQSPRLSEVLSAKEVPLPVIDMAALAGDEAALAVQVARASEEFGFFMVINHGVPEEVWRGAAESVRDFFQLLPQEVKSHFAGEEGPDDTVRVYSYFLNDWEDQREVSMWSEVVNHVWHPTHDFTANFPPQIPPTYRKHVGAYAKEIGLLMTRLLRLLSKELGLEEDYLKMRLGDQSLYKCHGNYYPPCPDPDHAIGLPIHTDSLALTVVRSLDEIPGVQILKDENWVDVHHLPNSFIVNIGDQLEVLSNGRYKSALHRVVTNKSHARVSLAYFWGPGLNESIGPIDELVDDEHPPVYRSYVYKEFIEAHQKLKGKRRNVKALFLI